MGLQKHSEIWGHRASSLTVDSPPWRSFSLPPRNALRLLAPSQPIGQSHQEALRTTPAVHWCFPGEQSCRPAGRPFRSSMRLLRRRSSSFISPPCHTTPYPSATRVPARNGSEEDEVKGERLGKIPEEGGGGGGGDAEQHAHDRQTEEDGDLEVLQGRCLLILARVPSMCSEMMCTLLINMQAPGLCRRSIGEQCAYGGGP